MGRGEHCHFSKNSSHSTLSEKQETLRQPGNSMCVNSQAAEYTVKYRVLRTGHPGCDQNSREAMSRH